ncbi:hypothetical protein ACOMHN_032773 [Nucella lapillus]
MRAEFLNPKDYFSRGRFPIAGEKGSLYIPFFAFAYAYPLGPVVLLMEFDAGGAVGVEIGVDVRALDSYIKAKLSPWVSGQFRGRLSVSIVVASAGIDLIGWVLKTGFPLSLASNFTQFPVVSTKKLELELIPIELKLIVWVQILFIINIEKTIWHYRAPAISTTLWEKVDMTEDNDPPRFIENGRSCSGGRRRRQTGSSRPECTVYQLKGRHPKDPTFRLEFAVEDKQSALNLTYAVGDYPGGTNVQGWTNLSGSFQSPAEFPCGVPLYFLVKARNTQGMESTASCALPTFDCTFPDGRVDAAYRCSSHPSTLRSMVVVYEDSELQWDSLYHGVGYSPSSYGHEVLGWRPLTLHNSQPLSGVSGDLRYFSAPRSGRLSSNPERTAESPSALSCASLCVKTSVCVAFVYNKYLHRCELHRFTEGASAEREPNDLYQTYERLGKSYTATLRYDNLPLRQGTRYYVNADVKNVLGYRASLTSQGTMVDRTPPDPGPVGNARLDNFTADGCGASILQRCEEHVSGSLNHRLVIDGSDSRAIFNGNRRGQQLAFTIENYHAAANWVSFKDQECGLHGYAWSVGRSVCGKDVVSFVDPHASIPNPWDWTHTGLAKGLHLPDGPYYVSVQAVNDIIHGGDLVTTVCHSTPFVVDTTPPQFHAVQEFLFDESFRFLVVFYNVSDDISGVARMEFGLGRTKYDVMIRRYLPLEMRGVRGNTYLVNEEFETQDGVPAWIRLKVVNNVGLSATGSADSPILIDNTPPVAGQVMDGARLGLELCCQRSTSQICAQWLLFHDPDSHIKSFHWGVGSSPGKDDVVPFHSLSADTKQACRQAPLRHNVTYFSTIVADNKALNTKSANASSDGLLIDVTPPLPGTVSDGSDVTHDVNFTSETATVTASWAGFQDKESGLASYSVAVTVDGQLEKSVNGLSSLSKAFSDHSFSLKHKETVVVHLQASNRAGGTVTIATDGVLVDHTPPQMIDVTTRQKSPYQLKGDVLEFVWNFTDPESGLDQYRCVIFQRYQGQKTKFWPEQSAFHAIDVSQSSTTREALNLTGLTLQSGASYSLQVVAVNGANMASTHESTTVLVDTTPPSILTVSLTKQGEEEEDTDDNGHVIHVDGQPLWVTWSPCDLESGIKTSHVCVGPAGSSACLSASNHQYQTVDAAYSPLSVSFRNLKLRVSTEGEEVRYQAYVVTFNSAGVQSTVASSKPFLVKKANVPGVVLDGREVEDVDYSNDRASIAISFSGFSSEACGVVGYEWAVGTSPFASDLLSYTDYGLVVDGSGSGFAQVHLMLSEGQKYHSTVRARTGYGCHEPYILASSDGFILDTVPPRVSLRVDSRVVMSEEVVYQSSSNRLDVLWKAEDGGGVRETRLVQGVFDSSPYVSGVSAVVEDPVPLKRDHSSGDSLFSSLIVTDRAGNEKTVYLPPVAWDTTPPSFRRLNCSKSVSALYPLLRCSWDTIQEQHSRLSKILIGLGHGPSEANLLNMTSFLIHSSKWSYDVHHLLTASKVASFYVIVQAINTAGLKAEETVKVIHDVSPPAVDNVTVVTSPALGFHDVKQQCQTAQDHMEVLLTGVSDPESGLKSVEFALGTSKGRSDVTSFRECRVVEGMYVLENLALSPGATVYVTARVTNTVGLYAIVTSDAVVISHEPRFEVSDGPEIVDTDGQHELHVLQGQWRYTDPCPVLEVEWSVTELGGQKVTEWTRINPSIQQFYNDSLHLENFKTYINFVRIRDALNRSRVAFSDGVTVDIRLPATAAVRDGLGKTDVDFQQDTHTLNANWDSFGDPRSTRPSDQIVRYAAAIGTDTTQSTTRSDIHGFEDVDLSTHITFHGLNLTAKTQTYYTTVRAYSAAGSFVESSSNGIQAGFSGTITPGEIKVSRYQASDSSIRFSWTGFDSDMGITHFYAGVSSTPPPVDNNTHDCSQLMQNMSSSVLDVRALQALNEESMAEFTNVSLKHGGSYYITVVASDRMGHCSAVSEGPVVVDTTPPVHGNVTLGGHDAGSVIYLHDPDTLTVRMDQLSDPESGLDKVSVQLASSPSCDPASADASVLRTVEAKGQTTVTLRNLALKENTVVYFVRVTVTNGAGLSTEGRSRPFLLDTAPPVAGTVKLGGDWTGQDQTFQPHTHTISGMLALQSFRSARNCVTQTDLLSEEARKSWKVAQGNFTPQCVQLDPSGLHVLVQHNPFLSGVDKGAAQYGPLTWSEGDYKFRLSPALGTKNILSGAALASPDLHPPFSRQNHVCDDAALQSCDQERNLTTKAGPLGLSRGYGLGLTFYSTGSGLKLLFWTQDFLQLKQSVIALDFDPATVTADYTFRLQKRQESGNPLWGVTFLVNDHAVASVSGLFLPESFLVTVYGWNKDGFFPPVTNQFEPFRRITVVHNVSVPVAQLPLCSYGSAFRDSTSDVKEVWVGVSDEYNATANVAPYTLLKSFCLPCLQQCSHNCSQCSGDRLTEAFLVVPLVLQGLDLQAGDKFITNSSFASRQSSSERKENRSSSWDSDAELRRITQERSQYQLPTYYLDVRVVDHSGLETRVKSLGVVVDTSPPAFKSVACFNPAISADMAITELGNNHTVGVTWEVSEDISSVQHVQVYLGTAPGLGNIVANQVVGTGADRHVFDGLGSLLVEGKVYYVTVEANNTAGLRGKAWSNFTVRTSQPDISRASVAMHRVSTVTVGNVTVGMMDSIDSLELDLDFQPSQQPGSSDVEFYELAMGTTPGREDVFPRTVIGGNGTTKIVIDKGFVHRKEASAAISIGDYTKRNMSSNDRPDPSANLLSMEPGRCLNVTVYAVTKAHVAASLHRLVCRKRSADVLLTADLEAHTLVLSGSVFTVDPADQQQPGAFRVQSKMRRGGLMAGVLTSSDTTKQYGSSASADFSPFVVPSVPDDSRVSRWLKKRLKAMPEPHVYVSPVAEAEFDEDLEVNYTVPHGVHVPEGTRVELVVWNPALKKWEAPEEVCSTTAQSYNSQNRHLTAKLCAKLFSDVPRSDGRRKKRSTTSDSPPSFSVGPRMLTVAVITSSVPNQAPSMHNTSLTLREDGGTYNFTLTYTDPEGDEMTFSLPRQPGHGTALVTPDGKVSYSPHGNFTGKDTIYVQGKEALTAAEVALGLVPNVVSFNISVHVTDVNDPPDIFYLPSAQRRELRQEVAVGPTAGNGLNMTVYKEANISTSSSIVLGLVVFSDVDQNDTVDYASARNLSDTGMDFSERDVASDDPRLSTLKLTSSTGFSGKEIFMTLAPNYTGHGQYHARVKDAAGSYSLLLTLNVFALLNPCVHGACSPRNSLLDSCLEPRRAYTFDPYQCHCERGYEGEWCQTETDECRTATCSPITDCVDLIGEHRCDLNAEKMAAIIVSPLVAVVLVLVAVYKLKKRGSSKVEPLKESVSRPSPDSDRQTDLGMPVLESTDANLQPTFQFFNNPAFIYEPRPNPTAKLSSGIGSSTGQAKSSVGIVSTSVPAASTSWPQGKPIQYRKISVHPVQQTSQHSIRGKKDVTKRTKTVTTSSSVDDATFRPTSSSSTQSHYLVAGGTEDGSDTKVEC